MGTLFYFVCRNSKLQSFPTFLSYIPIQKISTRLGTLPHNLEKALDAWLLERNNRHIAILGDYGMGKTSFLKHYAVKLAKEILQKRRIKRFPVFIALTNTSPMHEGITIKCKSFVAEELGVDYALFEYLIHSGKILFILDGFDEMGFIGSQEQRLKQLDSIWQLATRNNKIIISGRPSYFPNEFDLIEGLNIKDQEEQNVPQVFPFCEKIVLDGFSWDQIKTVIGQAYPEKSEYLELLRNNKSLNELCERPSMLHIVKEMLPRIYEKQNSDRINAGVLFNSYLIHWIDRQFEKGILSVFPDYQRASKRTVILNFFRDLAGNYYRHGQGNLLLTVEVIYEELEPIINLLQFAKEEEKEGFRHEVLTSYFVERELNSDKYKFVHKSFYEYFVSLKISDLLKEGDFENDLILKEEWTEEITSFVYESKYIDSERLSSEEPLLISLTNLGWKQKLVNKYFEYTNNFFVLICFVALFVAFTSGCVFLATKLAPIGLKLNCLMEDIPQLNFLYKLTGDFAFSLCKIETLGFDIYNGIFFTLLFFVIIAIVTSDKISKKVKSYSVGLHYFLDFFLLICGIIFCLLFVIVFGVLFVTLTPYDYNPYLFIFLIGLALSYLSIVFVRNLFDFLPGVWSKIALLIFHFGALYFLANSFVSYSEGGKIGVIFIAMVLFTVVIYRAVTLFSYWKLSFVLFLGALLLIFFALDTSFHGIEGEGWLVRFETNSNWGLFFHLIVIAVFLDSSVYYIGRTFEVWSKFDERLSFTKRAYLLGMQNQGFEVGNRRIYEVLNKDSQFDVIKGDVGFLSWAHFEDIVIDNAKISVSGIDFKNCIVSDLVLEKQTGLLDSIFLFVFSKIELDDSQTLSSFGERMKNYFLGRHAISIENTRIKKLKIEGRVSRIVFRSSIIEELELSNEYYVNNVKVVVLFDGASKLGSKVQKYLKRNAIEVKKI